MRRAMTPAKREYRKQLRDPRWQAVRQGILELDGHRCAHCGRTGAKMHVHHREYRKGRAPWEYPLGLLETLCAGCHAREHDVVGPLLGGERRIRFAATDQWQSTKYGMHRSIGQHSVKLYQSNGGYKVAMERADGATVNGRKLYQSDTEAKYAAFDALENGKADKVLDRAAAETLETRKVENMDMETPVQTQQALEVSSDGDARSRPAYTAENIASALAQLGAVQLGDSPLGVIRDCTPEYAAELLKLRPTYQRKVDPRHAARIAVSIAIDRYYFLGDTIKFSANLDCVDGQHRLTAIAQGTAHLDLYVAIVPYEAFVYIDATQKLRTMEQIAKAHLERTIHGSVISGLLFDLHNFELRARGKMSRADCIALVADHPLLETIIQLHHEGTPKKLASGLLAGAARCMRSEYPEEAHRFFFAVARNDHTVDGEYSPACKMLCDHHLMVARTRNRRETQSTEGWQREEAARAIHAFNAYLRREPITMLRGTTDGVFPTVHRRGVRGQAKGLPVMTRSRNGKG